MTQRLNARYKIPWRLETDYCHHGMPLSNGVFGALVWFQEQTVMLTINRADYWDHRGGSEWTTERNYAALKTLLEQGDFDAAKRLYAPTTIHGKEKRPTRLPMGRYEVKLRTDVTIASAELDLFNGEVSISCLVDGHARQIKVSIVMDAPVLVVGGAAHLIEKVIARPAYEFPAVKTYYDDFDIPPHQRFEHADVEGWGQELPADPACAVVADWRGDVLRIAAEYGASMEAAKQTAQRHLSSGPADYQDIVAATQQKWCALWAQAADVVLPDEDILHMYYLGIYRMLGNSMPGKMAPTLQGPWAEEFRMPPWSSDYHFNINIQECLWPAYAANLLPSLQPLFQMINSWKPTLAQNAKYFVGIDDGYMLNHSTDDLGRPIGGMWTGTIDHANTSWVAQMMWQYGTYAMDEMYLQNEVYPFMKRALNVFMAMMEQDKDAYALPISVSPEYGGSSAAALGRNSTFFLVNVHFLCEKLIQIAEKYQIDHVYIEKVRQVQVKLPPFTTGPRQPLEFNPKGIKWDEELYLWEGQPLAVSHRHHSHLAGIYPFDMVDLSDEYSREIVKHSYWTWVDKGMGRWSGWSFPWASIIHNRMGNPDMALLCLNILQEVYMMPEYTSRHNANYRGFSQFSEGDVMQVEASIAAAAAVLEMFVQCVRGKVRVFQGLSHRFRNAEFAGIRTEGAFLLSGNKADGVIQWISIYSEGGGRITLENPFAEKAYVSQMNQVKAMDQPIIEIAMNASETVVISGTPEISASLPALSTR